MMVDLTNVERTVKDTHADTIRYEISMLEFCFKRLSETEYWENSSDNYAYIESYLLHYRNLIEFFSSVDKRENSLNLNNASPWLGREFNTNEKEPMHSIGRVLLSKYWEKTSRYLQHCTTDRRDNDLSWNIAEMQEEITPAISLLNESLK